MVVSSILTINKEGGSCTRNRLHLLKKISNQTSTYFNSNGTIPLISLDELPMIASNLPGSATHSCLASSKKLNAFLSIVSVTAFSSPGANFTFWKPFNSFTGRGREDFYH